MSLKLYKTAPTFIYNYRREGYIPPPVSTFEKRSSRFMLCFSQDALPPFETHYYHFMRFFNYHLVFKRASFDNIFMDRDFTTREVRLFSFLFYTALYYPLIKVFFDLELLYLVFIKFPFRLLRHFLL
ncbi:hypothetical protein BCS42_07035 [Crenothrix sp. D3]|nr:hypothetical protein BCS42_07035 [Crenothrix sp. D3]